MKIVVVNLYFGPCPAYFDAFLQSCAANPAIDFLFFVDFDVPGPIPANVRFEHTTLDAVRTSFQAAFDFPLALHSAYKLCDFRPAYGELFADHFAGYDWWGHCDFDMLFGDLTPVVEAAASGAYVKLFRRGHLTLYRNTAEINAVYRRDVGGPDFRDVFSSERFCLFDETNGIDKMFGALQMPVLRAELIADLTPRHLLLRMTMQPNHWGQYFVWTPGKLQCRMLFGSSRRFLYIHFQKRHMAERYASPGPGSTLLINQFGIRDATGGLVGQLWRWLSLAPNLAHLQRYYLPRVVRVVRRRIRPRPMPGAAR